MLELCNISNVTLINNLNMKIEDLSKMFEKKADILFLLEVMEHLGDKTDPYESR